MTIQSTGSLSDSEKPSSFQFGVWYPIETFPREGRFLLAYKAGGGPTVCESEYIPYGYDSGRLKYLCGAIAVGSEDILGWTPLPSPPGAELNFSDEAGSIMKIPSSKDLMGESE